ncbi:putative late blight resistance protein homolog R1B-12 [Salvia splendens]|uniref:putative late blight resistance protein homolog R1B-12 n=1 Tax=Salvia splendens TaxID=180675 RepID=UPI001C27CB26|nr:putative late blight resistance protein homolog R1B-12 [Salvia splendens]
MGGIGKTTLARNIFVSPLVQESFDVCAWSTISLRYNAREILRQILDQVDEGEGGDLSVDELGDHLYKYLFGRKYFIVMDDMWTIEAWDRVRRFFPDDNNGSRVVVTTRLPNLASQFNYSDGLDLKFLDDNASWDLFCKTVFGEETCPVELEGIGKNIVEGCKGLPLSVAEGLVKPINGKSLEEAVEEYMEELVDRNMVIVENRKRSGKLKSLKMHDLLRDSIYLFGISDDYVLEIWKVSQLRHVITDDEVKLDGAYCLPNSLNEEEDMEVLENLQTLNNVKNLKFGEGVLKRIPNIKKLKLYYDASSKEDCYGLNNLHCLDKLETLRLVCDTRLSDSHLVQEVSFSRSLKKLTLRETYLPWEDMNTKIGSLPLLQVIRLEENSFIVSEWETMEDQFLSLMFLQIEDCDLECWITENTHFPSLEHIVLCDLSALGEIPLSIGDIPTLQSIKVRRCSDSAVDSAERIKEEQQELGNENLLVLIVKNL